jgi:DNA replication protein DnaC
MIPKRYSEAKYEDVPANIRALMENLSKTRRGIYIHGDVGCGKTHIAYALKKWWDAKVMKPAAFWNTPELIREIKLDFDRQPIDKTRVEEGLIGKEKQPLLFLDDIGAEKMTDFVASTFYLIINDHYVHVRPIIYTSNLGIEELADRIGDRTASRIAESCDIIHLKGGDRRLS